MNQINNYAKPVLLLDFDLNKTIILEESSNGSNWEQMLVSILAENTFYDWEGKGTMSFKDFVCNVLVPGEKSDRTLKKKRADLIAHFKEWLEEQNHPAKDKVFSDYEEIKNKFTNSDTQEIETTVFNSFFVLLEKLRALNIPFIIKLRTFGKHLHYAVNEIEAHPSGIKFKRIGNISGENLSLKGEETIEKADRVFHTFLTSKEHFALQDDYNKWSGDKELARSGKPFIYDSKGDQYQVRNLSLFFDDNITGEEHDIVNPIDISNGQLSGRELLSRMLFKVNTVEAIINDNYFFDLVQKALLANGFAENIHSLPDELMAMIISLLPVKDILECSLVSKSWKNLTDSEEVWGKSARHLEISQTENYRDAVRNKFIKLKNCAAKAHSLFKREFTVNCRGDLWHYPMYKMKERSKWENKLVKGFNANIILLREGFDTGDELKRIAKITVKRKLHFIHESGYLVKELAKELISSDRVDEGLQIVENSNQIKTVRERGLLINDVVKAIRAKYPKTGNAKAQDLIQNKLLKNETLKEAVLYLRNRAQTKK